MFRQVILPDQVSGRLYLHAMPGRHEKFEQFVSEAQRVKLDVVVCLASESEVRSKSPTYSAARSSQTFPFPTRNFPIEDFGVPSVEERPAFRHFVQQIAGELHAGKAVLIHCRMGIGRTGTVATCVLLELGLETATAIRSVESAGSHPEVPEQNDLVAWYSSSSPTKGEV